MLLLLFFFRKTGGRGNLDLLLSTSLDKDNKLENMDKLFHCKIASPLKPPLGKATCIDGRN